MDASGSGSCMYLSRSFGSVANTVNDTSVTPFSMKNCASSLLVKPLPLVYPRWIGLPN